MEDSYTPIHNDVLEALAKINLSPYEIRMVFVIWRKTYGFTLDGKKRKKTDYISISQFCEMTQLPKSNVLRALNSLCHKNIIKRFKVYNSNHYGFNSHHDQWNSEVYQYNRLEIFERDKYTCSYCHKIFTADKLHVDHIIPLSQNGSNKPSNLTTACAHCNLSKNKYQVSIQTPKVSTETPEIPDEIPEGVPADTQKVSVQTHTKENKRKVKNNVKKKNADEIKYYAELLAKELGDDKSLAFYKQAVATLDPHRLLQKAKEIVKDGGAKKPGAVFTAWYLEEARKLLVKSM